MSNRAHFGPVGIAAVGFCAALFAARAHAEEKPSPLAVDKQKKSVSIACRVAPRKLPNLKDVYPVEVIATYPAPKGQKAHETVVTFENVKPSQVHQALVDVGLKPGRPARGEVGKAEGPEVAVLIEFAGPDGKPERVPIEKTLINRRTGKKLDPLKWHFTGSVFREPDPEKDDKEYGADITGTLITLFPVTDDTVLQTSLTIKDEPLLKLETDPAVLPKEGTPVKLIIEAK